MKYQTLQIFRPMISSRLTQGWGENLACIGENGKIFGISRGQVCPGQSFYQSLGMDGHNGIDINAIVGENVYHAATYDGWIRNETDSAGGVGVDVVSSEPLFFPHPIPTELINTAVPCTQDGKVGFTHYIKMRYWHLSKGVGHDRKKVTPGTIIGLAGNTGASSGPHLHFAPKWCLRDGRSIGNGNGFFGAFDPTPYYNHQVLVTDHVKFLNTPAVAPTPLTPQERKDIMAQLSLLQQIVLLLQKMFHKI